jgi:hypothetical protein
MSTIDPRKYFEFPFSLFPDKTLAMPGRCDNRLLDIKASTWEMGWKLSISLKTRSQKCCFTLTLSGEAHNTKPMEMSHDAGSDTGQSCIN